jgi:hypothetical protein
MQLRREAQSLTIGKLPAQYDTNDGPEPAVPAESLPPRQSSQLQKSANFADIPLPHGAPPVPHRTFHPMSAATAPYFRGPQTEAHEDACLTFPPLRTQPTPGIHKAHGKDSPTTANQCPNHFVNHRTLFQLHCPPLLPDKTARNRRKQRSPSYAGCIGDSGQ